MLSSRVEQIEENTEINDTIQTIKSKIANLEDKSAINNALQRINSKIALLEENTKLSETIDEINAKLVELEEKTETLIQIKPKAFSEQELKWWKGFGVTEKTLKKYKVFSCDSIFLNGDYFSSSSPRVPIYGYYCGKKNGQELWRIYFPSKRSFRFLSNVGKSYIQGAKQLPKTGDVLLITKSQKDVMLAYELGIPAIAPCSEVLFLSNKQIQHLKKRFKTIVVCYDTDITGIHNLKQIKVKYPDLHTFFIPRKYGVKDISDFFKKYGEEETRRLAGELLKYYRSVSDRKEK